MTKSKGYVLYWCEHLRDGVEEGARVFTSIEAVETFLNKKAVNFFAFDNHEFQLFKLGKELPLKLAKSKKIVHTEEVRQFKIGE